MISDRVEDELRLKLQMRQQVIDEHELLEREAAEANVQPQREAAEANVQPQTQFFNLSPREEAPPSPPDCSLKMTPRGGCRDPEAEVMQAELTPVGKLGTLHFDMTSPCGPCDERRRDSEGRRLSFGVNGNLLETLETSPSASDVARLNWRKAIVDIKADVFESTPKGGHIDFPLGCLPPSPTRARRTSRHTKLPEKSEVEDSVTKVTPGVAPQNATPAQGQLTISEMCSSVHQVIWIVNLASSSELKTVSPKFKLHGVQESVFLTFHRQVRSKAGPKCRLSLRSHCPRDRQQISVMLSVGNEVEQPRPWIGPVIDALFIKPPEGATDVECKLTFQVM
mmetsp:Transcript_101267/g.178277  ORF Transcript_101267/g.178277 Transcript_101267/m.178277 type:complete len:338 (-) Transcript_101267:77-1090(-)